MYRAFHTVPLFDFTTNLTLRNCPLLELFSYAEQHIIVYVKRTKWDSMFVVRSKC